MYHRHIETNSGRIWIIHSSDNGFVQSNSETRQNFESRVMKKFLGSTLGDVELDHLSNGAPFIVNRPDLNISISHSENWFALYLSTKGNVGVDIEIPSTKINQIQSHFLQPSEILRLTLNPLELRQCWGIKEAVFKLFRGEIESMKEEIEIINLTGISGIARSNGQEVFLKFLESEHYTLVYTC